MSIETGNPNQTPEQMMKKVQEWISQMEARATDLTPVLTPISQEVLLLISDARKNKSTPLGVAHAPLSPVTLQLYSKGIGQASTGRLASSFTVSIANNTISLNSPLPYANTQFYGNPNNHLFGKSRAPVPARPYLDVVGGQLTFPPGVVEEWISNIYKYIYEGEL